MHFFFKTIILIILENFKTIVWKSSRFEKFQNNRFEKKTNVAHRSLFLSLQKSAFQKYKKRKTVTKVKNIKLKFKNDFSFVKTAN